MTTQQLKKAILQTPYCSKIETQQLIQALQIGIARTALCCGTSLTEKDLIFTSEEVAEQILANYKELHLGEIPILLNSGVYGTYGEFYGVNAVSICKWITGYLNSDIRKITIQDINRVAPTNQLPQQTPLTPEREYKAMRGLCEMMFDYYISGNSWRDPNNYIYFFLEQLGLINLTIEEKNIIFNKVLSNNPNEQNPKYESRKMAVKEFFETVHNSGRHILDYIPEKMVPGYSLIEF